MNEITKTWMTKSGKLVTVTGSVITERAYTTDSDEIQHKSVVETVVNISVEGVGNFGGWVRKMQNPQGDITHYVAQSGTSINLGMTDEQAEIVESVYRELRNHPAVVARDKRIAKNEADENELNEIMNRVERS